LDGVAGTGLRSLVFTAVPFAATLAAPTLLAGTVLACCRHGFAAGGHVLSRLVRSLIVGFVSLRRHRRGHGIATMFAVAIPATAPPAALAALAAVAVLGPLLMLALLRMARLFGLHRNLFFLFLDDDFVLGLFRLDIGRQAAHLDETFRLLGNGAAEDGVMLGAQRLVGFDGYRQTETGLQLDQRGTLVV